MSRPRPLTNLTYGRPSSSDYQSLTPRTPHSRSGRAEEGYTEHELEQSNFEEDDEDDDYQSIPHQQSAPLLSSSASDSFPPSGARNRGDDYDQRTASLKKTRGQAELDWPTIASRIPLVLGCMVAAMLLGLTVLSLKRPETLQKYIGAIAPQNETSPTSAVPGVTQAPHSDLHTISYENYTKFPLSSTQYLTECYKLNPGLIPPMEYWTPGPSGPNDVLHHDDKSVCKSTITYMLDGRVGLLADLALMAQAAALAREVEGE